MRTIFCPQIIKSELVQMNLTTKNTFTRHYVLWNNAETYLQPDVKHLTRANNGLLCSAPYVVLV